MQPTLAAALFLAALVATGAKAAESRCSTMGQLALSGHVGVLAAIGSGDRSELITATANARHMIGYYRDLGCAMEPVIEAIECVNTAVEKNQNQNTSIGKVADQCMKDAGFNK